MPCLSVHLAIAKKYCESHLEENVDEFIKGTLEPDIADDKVKAHYGSNYQTNNIIEYMKKKVDFNNFLNDFNLDTSFNRGYFLHLIADYEFFGKYITSELLQGKSTKEIVQKGYQDYNYITPILIKKYGLEIPDYLPQKFKDMLSFQGEGTLELITLDVVNNFIDEISQVNLEEYSKKYLKEKITNNILH